jgi:hypothetical protein
LAFGADALDEVVALSAIAFAGVEVVNLICSAFYSANALVNVVELSFRAFGAEIVDEVVSGFAYASVQDPIFVDGADGGAYTFAALS